MIYFHNPNTRSDRNPPIAPMGAKNVGTVVIRKFAAHMDYTNTRTFAKTGGMSGRETGGFMCNIPQAFQRAVYP